MNYTTMKKLYTLGIMALSCAQFGLAQDCEGLSITEVIRDPVNPSQLVIKVENNSEDLFDYPGFRVYNAETEELIGEEVVNFFGIGQESVHEVPVDETFVPGLEYDLEIELWTGFYDQLACSRNMSSVLYPVGEYCMNTRFQAISTETDGGEEPNFYLELQQDGEIVFTDNFGLSQQSPMYISDDFCLESGCYTGYISTTDAVISMSAQIQFESEYWQYFGITQVDTGVPSGSFEFEVFDCNINSISDRVEAPIQLYPNPVQNTFRLELQAENFGQFQLMDLQGRTVKLWNITQSITELDISELPAGTYVLSSMNASIATQKLMKH